MPLSLSPPHHFHSHLLSAIKAVRQRSLHLNHTSRTIAHALGEQERKRVNQSILSSYTSSYTPYTVHAPSLFFTMGPTVMTNTSSSFIGAPPTTALDIAEFEKSLALDAPISTSVMPRWQRKQLQQSSNVESTSTPESAPSSASTSMCSTSSACSNNKECSTSNQLVAGETRDRFIPHRSSMHMDRANYLLSKENGNPDSAAADNAGAGGLGGTGGELHKALEQNLLGVPATINERGHRVLAFQHKAPAPEEGYQNGLKVLYSQNKARTGMAGSGRARATRHIPSAPARVLDAPDLLDDYYLNLLSWGANDILAVALGSAVYLWNAKSGDITELLNLEGDDYVSSVSWMAGGNHVAVGTAGGETQLWDTTAVKQLRTMIGHSARVGALSWYEHVVTSGSRDTTAVHHDVRAQRHAVGTLRHHTQEVCGLAWSPDGTTLASGANDNTLCLWDASVGEGRLSTAAPRFTLTDHQAAVKALAWCPFKRNTLASGGGTADRCIKIWNSQTGGLLNSVDTGSQVCALLWSHTEEELLSSHGYAENQLCLWKYPSMVKTKELTGHTSRVLHLAASPDGRQVVSGAGDETLRFWDVFAPPSKSKGEKGGKIGGGRFEGEGVTRPLKIR